VSDINTILELRQKRAELVGKCDAILEKAEKEKRLMTPEEQQEWDGHMDEIRQNKAEETRFLELHGEKDALAGVAAIRNDPVRTAPKSVGQAFVESRQYQEMIKAGRKTSDPFEYREIISGDAGTPGSAGDLVIPYRIPGIIAEPDRGLRIRDLLPVVSTGSNSIEFVRETLFTNTAAAVKEVTEALKATVAKPESSIRFDKTSVPVETIAHWIPATRQIIEDAPSLRGYIDQRLTYGLKLEEEDQLLFGNGTAPNLNGLCTQATAYDNTIVTDDLGIATPNLFDHIRAAILQARLAEYPVTGLVLNPTDWAAMELAKDSTGRYLIVTINEGGIMRLWRIPVVETTAMNAGEFLVGAFNMGAAIYDRQAVTIRVSESHEDFFIKNLLAILCEERIALVVYRPQAFIYGAFESGS
jgi:HK97 family phage major capsid protein